MAIEARVVFINALEARLAQTLTQVDLKAVMMSVADELDMYEISQISCTDGEPDDLLDAFLSALQVQGRSEKTIERYRYIIGRLLKEIKIPTRSITVYHLRKYLANEKARGISDSTLEGDRQIFSSYFNWLSREGLIEKNPTANLGSIKCAKKIKLTYSDVDIERMKFGCKTVRDRAIIMFLLTTGCRISEMTQLNISDIDFTKMEVKVLGKGAKERTVYFDTVTAVLLKEYIGSRKDDSPALFAGIGSERLLPGSVRFMLKDLEERTGVEHIHPHKFRRTLATNLIKRGMPIQEVAAILGHDKLDTTMRYVVLNDSDIKYSYAKYS